MNYLKDRANTSLSSKWSKFREFHVVHGVIPYHTEDKLVRNSRAMKVCLL